MAFKLAHEQFDEYIKELGKTYRVMGPTRLKGKGKFSDADVIGYGEIKSSQELELNEKSYYSPKEIFYPIRETLFYFADNEVIVPKIDVTPIVLLVRPCDINGIQRLDEIFLKNGDFEDTYYKRRRELLKFVMIECTEGFESCYCVSMDSNKTDNYEAALSINESGVKLKIVDTDLITDSLGDAETIKFEPDFIKENIVKVTVPPIEKLTNEIFNNEIWKEYTRRCIACGRCNTSCITCSCFTMQDVNTQDNKNSGERRRRWAGCHVDGFSDMAGGHGFRDKNGERMRFKTMHKINDFNKRFGYHMCVGCGRCDDVCPEYISFSKCINKLNKIIEEGEDDK